MFTPLVILPVLYVVFADTDGLRVNAEPAVAVLPLQQDGRNLVRLPELEFRLSVAPYCANGRRPESLSVTIADTRTTLRREQLEELSSTDLVMRIPAGQVAPFALRQFCTDPASAGDSLLLTAALAAQASLRCSDDGTDSIVFAAAALDIRVYCLRSATAAEPPRD